MSLPLPRPLKQGCLFIEFGGLSVSGKMNIGKGGMPSLSGAYHAEGSYKVGVSD